MMNGVQSADERHNAESGFIELVNNHNVFDGGLEDLFDEENWLSEVTEATVVTEGQVSALR